jgi:glutaredoxin 3
MLRLQTPIMSHRPWILFVKSRCPWCVEAIGYLSAHGYAFEQVDVLRDRTAYERMQKISGQHLTPTLLVEDGELVLADFDTRQLEKFIQEHDLLPG